MGEDAALVLKEQARKFAFWIICTGSYTEYVSELSLLIIGYISRGWFSKIISETLVSAIQLHVPLQPN